MSPEMFLPLLSIIQENGNKLAKIAVRILGQDLMSPEMLPPLLSIIQENRNKVAKIAVKILEQDVMLLQDVTSSPEYNAGKSE